jgi:hypothetical protein
VFKRSGPQRRSLHWSRKVPTSAGGRGRVHGQMINGLINQDANQAVYQGFWGGPNGSLLQPPRQPQIVHTTLAVTDAEGVITDEPDVGASVGTGPR